MLWYGMQRTGYDASIEEVAWRGVVFVWIIVTYAAVDVKKVRARSVFETLRNKQANIILLCARSVFETLRNKQANIILLCKFSFPEKKQSLLRKI